MLQSHEIGCLTAEEELGEKLVFRKAFRYRFLQPACDLCVTRFCQAVNLAVGAASLHNHFDFYQPGLVQVLEHCIDLAVTCIPIAGDSAVTGLFDIVATNGTSPEQP